MPEPLQAARGPYLPFRLIFQCTVNLVVEFRVRDAQALNVCSPAHTPFDLGLEQLVEVEKRICEFVAHWGPHCPYFRCAELRRTSRRTRNVGVQPSCNPLTCSKAEARRVRKMH